MITLMEKYNDTAFEYEFPKLIEITEFLLIYRVNGIKTFIKMFPNLRLIRGNTLFINYALVVFELLHLQVSL